VPKAKPTSTEAIRIELQTREREMLEQYLAAYTLGRAGVLAEGLGVPEFVKMMKDPKEVVEFLYSVAIVAEALGIETGLPTPVDAVQWFQEYQARSAQMAIDREECGGSVGVLGQILDSLRVLFGADEEVLRSRWDCPEPGEEPPIGGEENPGEDAALPSDEEEDDSWRPGHGVGGGGPFGGPI